MNITDTIVRRFGLSELHENEGQIPDLPANPRLLRNEKYNQLVQSIREGDLTGVLPMKVFYYNEQWVVLGGNMRLRAMKELNKEYVSCIVIPGGHRQGNLAKNSAARQRNIRRMGLGLARQRLGYGRAGVCGY